MNLKIKTLALFIAVALTGCNKAKPIEEEKGFDYGSVKDGLYTNNFFDIQVDVPKDWKVQSQEQSEAMMKQGAEAVAGDNKRMKAALKASEVNTASLLTVFQHDPGAAVEYNPNFMLVAENLKAFPGIKTGKEYLFQTRKILSTAQVNYTYMDEDFKKEDINGIEFYVMNVRIDIGGGTVQQSYLATVKDGFALGFIYSWHNDEEKAKLEKIKNSIKPTSRSAS
jgi:hypothetical protein